MDERRFDALVRAVAADPAPRRAALRFLAGGALGGLFARLASGAMAAECLASGKGCRRGSQCCTGFCNGRDNCACKPAGMACADPGECCMGLCEGGSCACPPDQTPCAGKCCAPGQRCKDGRCVADGGAGVACPDCGECEACDEKTGECGLACTDPCLAAALCRRANDTAKFRRLVDHLTEQGYQVEANDPFAIQLRGGRAKAGGVFIRYVGPNAGEAAALSFSLGPDGYTVPVAILVRDDQPYAVVGIDKEGDVETIPVGAQTSVRASAEGDATSCYPVCGLGGCGTCEPRCRYIRRFVWGVGSAVVAARIKGLGANATAGTVAAMNAYGNAGVDECKADCDNGVCGSCSECNRATGKCKSTCEADTECCEGICVDISTDPANCGACGNDCATGEQCLNGDCCPSKRVCDTGNSEVCCPDGYACCQGGCYIEDSTPCGSTCCFPGASCLDAQASLCCFDGQVECGGGCCFGTCCNGTCCPSNKVCEGNTCKCRSGQLTCGDTCCPSGAGWSCENRSCKYDCGPDGCGG